MPKLQLSRYSLERRVPPGLALQALRLQLPSTRQTVMHKKQTPIIADEGCYRSVESASRLLSSRCASANKPQVSAAFLGSRYAQSAIPTPLLLARLNGNGGRGKNCTSWC